MMADSEPSPYRRFESFLRKLVAVPKAEIDAKAAEQKRHAAESPFPKYQRGGEHAQP
jgi:hypothetical protein